MACLVSSSSALVISEISLASRGAVRAAATIASIPSWMSSMLMASGCELASDRIVAPA